MGKTSNQFRGTAWQILWDCRGLLAFLGIVIHSSSVYAPDVFALSDGNSSIAFKYLRDFIHSFRMEAFFVLSGCSAHIIFEQDRQNFLANRAMRLFVPFFVTVFFLNIPMAFLGEAILGWPVEGKESANIFSLNYWMSGGWVAHLWFIRDLMVFTTIYVLLLNCKQIVALAALARRQCLVMDIEKRRACLLVSVVSLALLPSALSYIFPGLYKGVLGEGNGLLGNYKEYLAYSIYFALGVVIAKVPNSLAYLTKKDRVTLFVCISLCTLRGILLLAGINEAVISEVVKSSALTKIFLETLRQAAVLSMLYLTFQFVCFLRATRFAASLKEWSQASYTVYLLHLPVIWFFAIALKPMDDPIIWKFCFMVFATSVVCLSFHSLFVIGRIKLTRFLFTGQLVRT
jgi:glucans biosynthesis protein C